MWYRFFLGRRCPRFTKFGNVVRFWCCNRCCVSLTRRLVWKLRNIVMLRRVFRLALLRSTVVPTLTKNRRLVSKLVVILMICNRSNGLMMKLCACRTSVTRCNL